MRNAESPKALNLVLDDYDDVEIIHEPTAQIGQTSLYVYVSGVTVLSIIGIKKIVRGKLEAHNEIEDTSL